MVKRWSDAVSREGREVCSLAVGTVQVARKYHPSSQGYSSAAILLFRPTTSYYYLSATLLFFLLRTDTHTHTHTSQFLKMLMYVSGQREKLQVERQTTNWSSVCDRKIMKGAFLAEPCTFSAASRHPLQGFSSKFMSVTLSTLDRNDIILFAIYQ